MRRTVVITGYAVLSCHGDADGTFAGLAEQRDGVKRLGRSDHSSFPYDRVHAAAGLEAIESAHGLDRTHVRAMGLSMRYANAAASMALRHAGLSDRPDLREHAGLFVAARFGERDEDVDFQITSELAAREDYELTLNALLARHLRPGLFLAQLPNLFAGNISLIHQLKGPSITFLGEHSAGGRAVVEAAELVADGEVELALVGGAHNGAEYLTRFGLAGDGALSRDRSADDRRCAEAWVEGSDGTVPGTGAAFLVLETLEHATRRGASVRAELAFASAQTRPRDRQSVASSLQDQYRAWLEVGRPVDAFIGNGSGNPDLDAEELEFLATATAGNAARVLLTTPTPGLGDVSHAAFPMRIALAAAALERGELFSVGSHPRRRGLPENVALTAGGRARLESICAIALGHHYSESVAVVSRHASAAGGN